MAKNPPSLKVVPAAGALGPEPARPLGQHGRGLWDRIMSEYRLEDSGGVEMLLQACQQLDEAEELREAVVRDGAVVMSRYGPKEHPALKLELACRSFVVRTLHRLGLDVEPIRSSVGRPPGGFGGRTPR
jgi:hypothetical protein